MKKILILSLCIALLGFSSCKKCYTCTADLPVYVNGVEVATSPFETSFCGRGYLAQQQVDQLEDEGYTCIQD